MLCFFSKVELAQFRFILEWRSGNTPQDKGGSEQCTAGAEAEPLFPRWNPQPAQGRGGKCHSADVSPRFGLNLDASSCPRATTPTMWRRSGASSSLRCWSARSSCGRRWRGWCCAQAGTSPAPPSAQRDIQNPSLIPLCHSRLELLLQIANKIQNGALSCEEKLTLAKNTLQAVSGEWGFPLPILLIYLFSYSFFVPISSPLFCLG